MRPRIEGISEEYLLSLLATEVYKGMSPTQVIETLITQQFNALYPRGEADTNGNTEAETIRDN